MAAIRRNILISLTVFVLIGGGLALAPAKWQEYQTEKALNKDGEFVTGEIGFGSKLITSNSSASLDIKYHYEVDGKAYSGEQTIGRRLEVTSFGVREPAVGDSIQVEYLPEDPSVSRLEPRNIENLEFQIALGLGMLVLGILGILWVGRNLLKSRSDRLNKQEEL